MKPYLLFYSWVVGLGKSSAHILKNVGRWAKSLYNGEYWIKGDSAGPMRVYCDMMTNEGRLNTM